MIGKQLLDKYKNRTRKLSNVELIYFFEQLSLMLHAGISTLEGISILAEDAATEDGTEIMTQLQSHMEETGSLCESMTASEVFPSYAIHMIRIGEESGHLDDVTKSLAEYYTRDEQIRKEVQNAITYPIIMIGIMLVIIAVLLTKVLPIFNQVYRQLGSEMTGFSRNMMNLGTLIGKYGFIVVGIILILAILLAFGIKTKKIRIPFAKNFYRNIAEGRFADGMALTLHSGLDTEQSLAMISDLVEDSDMQAKIQDCLQKMEEGSSFSHALKDANIFSGMYARMIAVGERSGAADEVMKKTAGKYTEDINNRIAHMISILEPTLVAILSVVVGVILLSVMLPLLGIMSGMNMF